MADNTEVIVHVDAGMNSVGINTATPVTGSTAGLTVEGGISASGDIFSEGTVSASNFYLTASGQVVVHQGASGENLSKWEFHRDGIRKWMITNDGRADGDAAIGVQDSFVLKHGTVDDGNDHINISMQQDDQTVYFHGTISASGDFIQTGDGTEPFLSASLGNLTLSGSGTAILNVDGDITASGTIYGQSFVSQSVGGDVIANTLRVGTDALPANMEMVVAGDISASGDFFFGDTGGDYFSGDVSEQTIKISGDQPTTLELNTTGNPTKDLKIKFTRTDNNYMAGFNSGLNTGVFVIASGSTNTAFDNPIMQVSGSELGNMVTVAGDISASGGNHTLGGNNETVLTVNPSPLPLISKAPLLALIYPVVALPE